MLLLLQAWQMAEQIRFLFLRLLKIWGKECGGIKNLPWAAISCLS